MIDVFKGRADHARLFCYNGGRTLTLHRKDGSNEELFDYGANLQAVLDYIDMVDWSDLRAAAQVN
jgi:hypothetical protein